MKSQSIIQLLADKFEKAANVKSVYGDPIKAHGKTVIPIARISYGIGAGGAGKESETDPQAGGGGGGIRSTPLGVMEITEEETRFIPSRDWKFAAQFLSIGVFLGYIIFKITR